MTMMTRIFAGGAGIAGIAALAAAAPAAAQYGYGYAQPYAYGNQYQQQQNMTHMAAQRCSAAVQQRLQTRNRGGLGAILGAIVGVNTTRSQGRVLGVTQVRSNRNMVRVRGVASSGASQGYGPYGVGAYGAVGYAHQPDLTFKCDVDYRGRIRDVDIDRRR